MKQTKRPQGKTTNKLIITWKDYSTKDVGTERESHRCNSEQAAKKILGKRTQNRMYFAKWFDEKGNHVLFNINTKDTILSI